MSDAFAQAAAALAEFRADPANLARVGTVAREMAGALASGGKILACGNGGSLCDAMHLRELTGRFRDDPWRPLAAVACTIPAHHLHRQRLRVRARLCPMGAGSGPAAMCWWS